VAVFAVALLSVFGVIGGVNRAENICFGAENAQNAVYLGGTPMGIAVKSKGVTVINISDVLTESGLKRPAEECGLLRGDLIIKMGAQDIKSAEDINKALAKNPQSVEMLVLRKGEPKVLTIIPATDVRTQSKKLGIQIKNEVAGVGTLTYVRGDNKRFGCLGHQIFDLESTNENIYNLGSVYNANIIGYVKGEQGKAGELRGAFGRRGDVYGSVDANNFAGIFGEAERALYDKRPMISVGSRHTVKPGKAHIYTTINGDAPKCYEIEIIKASRQDSPQDKGMVISIKDERLLSTTGGIVQGMSGSPIVQNGVLIGAVTHVFLNDPTKGYGIYVDWMLMN